MGPLPGPPQRCSRSAGTREVALRNSEGIPRLVSLGPNAQPTPKFFAGKDVSVDEAAKCLKREVSPQAVAYFQRIVKVAHSELEKLLVNKMQAIFEPSSRLVPTPCDTSGKDAHCEGQDLTQYMTGVLSRILLDFSRFSDTILRWEIGGRAEEKSIRKVDTDNSDGREMPSWVEALVKGPSRKDVAEPDAEALVSRLERQDQQNTALEEKYTRLLVEVKENRRAFLRERQLFHERLRILKSLLSEAAWREYEEHDVQFYEDEEGKTEDPAKLYEEKIAKLRAEMQGRIDNLQAQVRELQRDKLSLEQEKEFLMEQLSRLKSLLKKEDAATIEVKEQEVQATPKVVQYADEEIQCQLKPDLLEQGVQTSEVTRPARATKPKRQLLRETKLDILGYEIPSQVDVSPVKSPEVKETVIVKDQSEEIDALKKKLAEAEAAVRHLVTRVSGLQGRLSAHCELIAGKISESGNISESGKKSAPAAPPSQGSDASSKAASKAASKAVHVKHMEVQTEPMPMPIPRQTRVESAEGGGGGGDPEIALESRIEEHDIQNRPKQSERPPIAGGFLQGGEIPISPRPIETKAGLYVIARREALSWVARHCGLRELLREGYHPSEPLTKDEYEMALGVLGTSPFEAKSLFTLAGNGASTATLEALFSHVHSVLFGDSLQFCGVLAGDCREDIGGNVDSAANPVPRFALAKVPASRPRSAVGGSVPGRILHAERPKSAPGPVSSQKYAPPITSILNSQQQVILNPVIRQNYGGGFCAIAGHGRPISANGTEPTGMERTVLPDAFAFEPGAEPAPSEMDFTLTQPAAEPSLSLNVLNLDSGLDLSPVDEKQGMNELKTTQSSASPPAPASPSAGRQAEFGEPKAKAPLNMLFMSGPVDAPTVQHRFPSGKPLGESMQGMKPRSLSRPNSAATAPMPDREPSRPSSAMHARGAQPSSAAASRPGSAAPEPQRALQSGGASEATLQNRPPRTLMPASPEDLGEAPAQVAGVTDGTHLLRTMSVPDFPIERPGELVAGFGAPMRGAQLRPAQQRTQGRIRPATPTGPPGAALRSRVAPAVSAAFPVEERQIRPEGRRLEPRQEPPTRPSRYLPQDFS